MVAALDGENAAGGPRPHAGMAAVAAPPPTCSSLDSLEAGRRSGPCHLVAPRGRIVVAAGGSGCGKSTLVRAVLGILPRAARVEAGQRRAQSS